jgi:hypothetical protein
VKLSATTTGVSVDGQLGTGSLPGVDGCRLCVFTVDEPLPSVWASGDRCPRSRSRTAVPLYPFRHYAFAVMASGTASESASHLDKYLRSSAAIKYWILSVRSGIRSSGSGSSASESIDSIAATHQIKVLLRHFKY